VKHEKTLGKKPKQKRMEAFVAKLWNDAYDKLTVEYHEAINDLEMSKRSMGDVISRFNLTLLPVVPLPEFDTREVAFPQDIQDAQYLNEDSVVVLLTDELRIFNPFTGETLHTVPRDRLCRYYQDKAVSHYAGAYEETDTTLVLPAPHGDGGYMCFYARNPEGRVQAYEVKDYLPSHGEVFRKTNELWFGNHCVTSLRSETTKEETAFFTHDGYNELFRYRGEWYQNGGTGEERKLWHCSSRVEVPLPWRGSKYTFVHNDRILLRNYEVNRNVLQILTPRLPAAE
jgi:hypothetical protein